VLLAACRRERSATRPWRISACVASTFFVVACASARGGGGLEPRFVAVHNALAAMGLVQVGPIHEGVLGPGREARVALQLTPGCTTIAVVGGEGIRVLDATLTDPEGRPVAHDTTDEPEAVLRWCVEGAADAYVLVLRVALGAGPWVVATWQGGGPGGGQSPGTAPDASAGPQAEGTCESPIALGPGVTVGSTTRGEHENAGSCGPSDSRELVYIMDVARRERVTIEVEAHFDSVLYVRKDDCSDPNAEVDCSDDAPDRTHSRVERVLEPGRYFVFVDGYAHDAGQFKLSVTASDVLALSDVCRRAPLLGIGVPASGTTIGMGNDAEASCPAGADGADAPWRLELSSRSRLRLVERSDEVTPVVHIRHACADEQSEIACADGAGSSSAVITGVFDPGSYTVFADAHDLDAAGRYSLEAEVAPTAGGATATQGDACADAIALGAPSSAVSGDTFSARDDVAGSCGGAGAPDIVYRVDVPRRSRLMAAVPVEEAPHVLIAWHRCGDRASEIACGRRLDAVLAPGTYYVAVDGLFEGAIGRYTLQWSLQDLTVQAGACLAAASLVDGHTVAGTTNGTADKFSASCATSDDGAGGPDRVYKVTLAARARVHFVLVAPSFDASMSIRRTCADASGGSRAAEIACVSDAPEAGQPIVIDRTLEAGTYWVVVDGRTPNDQGSFTLEYRTTR
jgi:hypothetical protein